VKNESHRSNTDFSLTGDTDWSRIELLPSQKPFMYKLEEEKYLTIVYYLHKARRVRSVFTRGLDGKEVGVFASRTPDRLSRIAIQDVRLLGVEGTTIYVEGLDAIDGSPVLDIKLRWSFLRKD
ncbi:MAG: SAM-dependent methyltransferase, partial [Candidatus Krumholzibacteria bacterium]|nr:SAM-dependent methyltransferase [Candidatus Krumholzibacteria bacterium]